MLRKNIPSIEIPEDIGTKGFYFIIFPDGEKSEKLFTKKQGMYGIHWAFMKDKINLEEKNKLEKDLSSLFNLIWKPSFFLDLNNIFKPPKSEVCGKTLILN